jgi:hypothetical protein
VAVWTAYPDEKVLGVGLTEGLETANISRDALKAALPERKMVTSVWRCSAGGGDLKGA